MQFHIGAVAYTVHRRWALKLDGEPVDAYCASSIRAIFLDADLDERVMEQTLRHEHAHCWEFEVGIPNTVEDRANFTATVGAAFERDFRAGGGLAAILAMKPEGMRPASSARKQGPATALMQSGDRIECGRCGAIISCGSIHTGTPRASDRPGLRVVDRGCQCPVCDTVQVWIERVSDDDFPTGEFFAARLLSGEQADQWMTEHRDIPSPYSQG